MKKKIWIIGIVILIVVVGGGWFLSSQTTCTQDAASNFLWSGQGTDPCDRSCESDDDCKLECGCDCISKNEKCIYTGIVCEMPDPDYGCKCVNNICKWEKIT